jgi:hypothetical protein
VRDATPEEEEMLKFTVSQLVSTLKRFLPGAPEQHLVECVMQCMAEQAELPQILDSVVDPKQRRKHPFWGIEVLDQNGNQGRVLAPKNLQDAKMHDVVAYVQVLSFIDSILPRALLRALGFQYRFFQTKGEPSRIITV